MAVMGQRMHRRRVEEDDCLRASLRGALPGSAFLAGGEKHARSPGLTSAGGRRREPRAVSSSSPGASAIWVRREGRHAGPWDLRAAGFHSAIISLLVRSPAGPGSLAPATEKLAQRPRVRT